MDELFEWVFIAAVALYLFAIQTPRRRSSRRSGVMPERTRPADALLDFVVFIGWQVLPLVAIFSDWLAFADYALPAWLGWPGVLLLAASLLVFRRANADLGDSWSPKIGVNEGQAPVTTGIYGRVRHPVYAAMWLWALAQPLLVHNWIGGPALLITFLPLYLRKIRQKLHSQPAAL